MESDTMAKPRWRMEERLDLQQDPWPKKVLMLVLVVVVLEIEAALEVVVEVRHQRQTPDGGWEKD